MQHESVRCQYVEILATSFYFYFFLIRECCQWSRCLVNRKKFPLALSPTSGQIFSIATETLSKCALKLKKYSSINVLKKTNYDDEKRLKMLAIGLKRLLQLKETKLLSIFLLNYLIKFSAEKKANFSVPNQK